jgi:hypothetical protein
MSRSLQVTRGILVSGSRVRMVAHLEWNCSRLRKLMKLSPGPVSVHPSQVSCITLQSLEPGCEAKERSAAGRRKSIARDCHEVPRFNRGDRTRPVAVSFSVAFHIVPSFDTKVRNVSLHVSSLSLVAYLWCVKTFTSVGPRYSVGEVRAQTSRNCVQALRNCVASRVV